MNELFTDGGIIGGKNPSPFGITFAYRIVEGEEIRVEVSGCMTCETLGTQTASNNNAELLALCMGIAHLPPRWRGRVNSDSQLALGWVFLDYQIDSIPPSLRRMLDAARARVRRDLDSFTFRLLQGHPTQADLACGIGKKRGHPVSIHNAACDDLCRRESRDFLARREA